MHTQKRRISIALGLFQKRHGDLRAIEMAKEIGADGMDFKLLHEDYRDPNSIYSRPEEEIAEYYTHVYEKAQALGIEIAQAHGRLRICEDNPADTEADIINARLDCLAAHSLHCPYVVMHGVTKYFNGNEPSPEVIHQLNETLFGRILEFAEEFQVKVATETFGDNQNNDYFFGQMNNFEESYRRICSQGSHKDHFVICMDTGHTHNAFPFNNNPSVGDAIRRLGSNIACLHLHDNDGISDLHRMPFSGSLDWVDVFNALDEIHYSGWYNLEIKTNTLKPFGKGFEVEYAAFAVKMLRFMLASRYGAENCCTKESDRSWIDYSTLCAEILPNPPI